MNSKREVKGETWSRGTNLRLLFAVNSMLHRSNLNLSNLFNLNLSSVSKE